MNWLVKIAFENAGVIWSCYFVVVVAFNRNKNVDLLTMIFQLASFRNIFVNISFVFFLSVAIQLRWVNKRPRYNTEDSDINKELLVAATTKYLMNHDSFKLYPNEYITK